MRKIILTLLLGISTLGAFGQKGQLWLGGTFNYDYEKQDWGTGQNTIQELGISPYVEYFFADTWSLYGGVHFMYSKESELDNFRGYDMGPFAGVTKYFPITDKFSFYTEFFVEGAWGTSKDNLTSYKNHHYSVGFSPGLNYNLSSKLCVYISLGELSYNRMVYKDKNAGQKAITSNFMADWLTQGFNIGLQFRLK